MTATDTVAPPRWFTTMDANKDGDISPREFLLGPEQFKKLDVDNDGLISPTEAVASPRDQPTNVKQKPASTPEKATASP